MNNTVFSDPALLQEIKKYARVKIVKKGDVVIAPGEKILFLPIVQTGVLRIIRQDENDREIFLYHLYPGQTCAMAINCCQSGAPSMVKAVAEDDASLLLIPVELTETWLRYPEWKAYINNAYALRFAELLEVIDLIAFSNMDKALLRYMQQRAKAANTNILLITHQQIADELHMHREAVSRLLRAMEQKGLVKLGRNSLELIG